MISCLTQGRLSTYDATTTTRGRGYTMNYLDYNTRLKHDEYDTMELSVSQRSINIEVHDALSPNKNSRISISHADFDRIADHVANYRTMAGIINLETE